jgi:hypothetical protein
LTVVIIHGYTPAAQSLGENIMVGKLTRFAVLPLMLLMLVAIGGANGQLTEQRQPLKLTPVEGSLKAVPPTEIPTVEQLVAKLEALRKQKADIERQERAVIEELKKAHKQLEERLSKLGVLPGTPPMVEPPLAIFPGSAPAKPK